MRPTTKVIEFVSRLMHFCNKKIGAGFALSPYLSHDATLNAENQRMHVEWQKDWDKFREFYINHT